MVHDKDLFAKEIQSHLSTVLSCKLTQDVVMSEEEDNLAKISIDNI
jgi:hypothetical protein